MRAALVGPLALVVLTASPLRAETWRLQWSDEFDSTVAGARPDPAKWTYDVGNDGFGNHELEDYCAPGDAKPPCDPQHPNAYLDGQGHLVIEARHTASGVWTSARLKTEGLAQFEHGRIEARIRLPVGPGLWPAFWMLGSNAGRVGWPACGEIDFMENVLTNDANPLGPGMISSTIHGEGYSGVHGISGKYTLPGGGRVDTDFHVYGALWTKEKISFYVDDWRRPFFSVSPKDVPAGARWPFDAPFYFIMNLAVGGDWPGPPNASTPDPSRMVVDYVRVYEAEPLERVQVSQIVRPFDTP